MKKPFFALKSSLPANSTSMLAALLALSVTLGACSPDKKSSPPEENKTESTTAPAPETTAAPEAVPATPEAVTAAPETVSSAPEAAPAAPEAATQPGNGDNAEDWNNAVIVESSGPVAALPTTLPATAPTVELPTTVPTVELSTTAPAATAPTEPAPAPAPAQANTAHGAHKKPVRPVTQDGVTLEAKAYDPEGFTAQEVGLALLKALPADTITIKDIRRKHNLLNNFHYSIDVAFTRDGVLYTAMLYAEDRLLLHRFNKRKRENLFLIERANMYVFKLVDGWWTKAQISLPERIELQSSKYVPEKTAEESVEPSFTPDEPVTAPEPAEDPYATQSDF